MKQHQNRKVNLPTPFDHQLGVLRSAARFKVIACGRRWGKTTLAGISCVNGHGPDRQWRGAVNGGSILWVAPTYAHTNEVWRFLKKSMELAWTDKNEVERRIELPGGGSITVRSADDPDSLRGVGYDGMVLDEAAFCREEAWTEAIRPALADRQGWGILVSTPKGQNWFFRLFRDAELLPNWERWQQPSTVNPLVTAEEAEEARRHLGAHAYAQEFLAEFVTPSGSRIQKEWVRYYRKQGTHYRLLAPDGEVTRTIAAPEFRRIIFVDPAGSGKDVQRERRGKQLSYTVIATFDIHKQEGILCWTDVVRGRWEVPDVCHEIEKAYVRNNPDWVGIENQGLGLAVYQAMNRTSVPIRPLKPGGKDKVERATKALVLMEQGKVYHPEPGPEYPWLKTLEDELLLWTGADDDVADQVDCLAYAAMEATKCALEGPITIGPILVGRVPYR